ncbi:MAG: hypothetical protein QQW96_20695 [Tychonema bourrellyi B0820]|nr:hypothetical protein [Tychonema bourrellyi B0820]
MLFPSIAINSLLLIGNVCCDHTLKRTASIAVAKAKKVVEPFDPSTTLRATLRSGSDRVKPDRLFYDTFIL